MFRVRTLTPVAVLVATFVALTACGGGGGGGGGGNNPGSISSLLLTAFPSVDATNGGATTSTTLNYATPSASMPMQGFQVPSAGAGTVHGVTLTFNRTVNAASIFPNSLQVMAGGNTFITSGNNSTDSIVLLNAAGTSIPLLIDSTGALNASNVFTAPNVAPAVLRLYAAVNVGGNLMPGALPDGQYRLVVIAPSGGSLVGLRGSNGQPFCLIERNGNCLNPVPTIYPFSVGADTTPITAAISPATPVAGTANVPLNQEFRIRFSEAIDFQSLVGNGNVTTADPFMSVVLPVNDIVANPFAMPPGQNILVQYTPIPGSTIPVRYGFVAYMPDPFRNPTEVRIRIVDNTTLVPGDLPPAPAAPGATIVFTQNYGLDNDVWEFAGQTVPLNNQGNPLSLPPILPLPGSDMMGNIAGVQINVLGADSGLASDTSMAGDGVLGVTDRNRNALATSLVFNYSLAQGPVPSNNPSPPDLHIVASGNVMTAVSTGRMTSNGNPFGTLLGQLNPVPNALNDPSVLSTVVDVGFGPFLNLTSATNAISNPPRTGADAALILMGGDPAIPPIANATPPAGGDFLGLFMGAPPVQPLGTFLYVIDGAANQVKIFDSTTFLPLGAIPGVVSPGGLGVAPNGATMYVSNSDQGTISRVGLQPANMMTFHQVTGTAAVGPLPKAVSVQPNNEDVLVLTSPNNLTRVTVASFSVRKTYPVGAGAKDIMAGPREACMGCTLAYRAWVTNELDGSVSVFESDSVLPQVMNSNGVDGDVVLTIPGYSNPTYGIYNQNFSLTVSGIGAEGFYVANSTGTAVFETNLINYNLGPQPGFQGTPAFRTFQVVQTLQAPFQFGAPRDVTLDAMTANRAWAAANRAVLVPYSNGEVAVFDVTTSAFLGSVTAPGAQIWGSLDQ